MEFKKEEIRDLIISIIGLTILSGIFDFANVIIYFFVYTISTLFKLIVQKYSAKKYELEANYIFNYNFFIVSLGLSLLSFGTVIFPILGFTTPSQKSMKRIGKSYSEITSDEKGWISLLGILSSIFLIIISSICINLNPLFFQKMIDINLLFLLFSLIPFTKFDVITILCWNRFLWVALLLCSFVFALLIAYHINIFVSILLLTIIFIVFFI
ncbi:MAG: hypothetical protein PHN56_03200, partial [Candidatus Nanoarchaeia archaeon]|nr:hypothetical protein [Candidatus Nanoarchaeia archaeon]